jgi:hypothetical protein
MTPPLHPILSREILRKMLAVLDAPDDGFVALVRVAGLDSSRDFRGAILDGVDFGTDDLTGFDFSGADLSRAILTRAAGLAKIVTDENTRLPDHRRRPPPDFDLAKVRDMVLAGRPPPRAWGPFIVRQSFTDEPLIELSPLARLAALRKLDLSWTLVRNLSPLSGLTAPESLDLSGTPVVELSPLSSLSALQNLNLLGTQVTDLSPLSKLRSLNSLILSGTRVSDLSPLSGLSTLAYLDLSLTSMADISPLSDLSALQSLDLNATKVRDISPIAHVRSVCKSLRRGPRARRLPVRRVAS